LANHHSTTPQCCLRPDAFFTSDCTGEQHQQSLE